MSVAEKIKELKKQLPATCTLISVSKTKSEVDILDAYSSGHRDFGENKVQELTSKYESLPKDIQWHMIGHLQRNKVKYIAPFVHLIHGVDSLKLLKEINKQGAKCKRIIPCLLQVHIAKEKSKFGFDETEILEILLSDVLTELKNVRIEGLMGMATNTDDKALVGKEFSDLKTLFDQLMKNHSLENVQIKTLSMGMSGDYPVALQEGSNMIRVGSLLFGERNYT